MIEAALPDARAELAALATRRSELEKLIAQAEATLGTTSAAVDAPATLTLHAALVQVITEHNNEWMTVRELTDAVNERGLYRTRDGSPVEVNQVHARTNNYSAIFEKKGSSVRLREESEMLETHSASVTVFRDDDEGFFDWLEAHRDGYIVNSFRNPKPHYLVLHRPGCPHFKGSPELNWTKQYVKLCSDTRADLETWASETVGGEPTLCPSCACFG